MKYRLTKSIPVPTDHQRGSHQRPSTLRVYPWADMEIGHSFFVPTESMYGALKKSVSLRRIAYGAAGIHHHHYTVRAVEEGRGASIRCGVRIWRRA